MTEEEIIQRAGEAIKRFDKLRIVGVGWSGDSRLGFQFNPESGLAGAAGGTPPPTPVTGACCLDGDCSITTQAICEAEGGTYQGDDTTCSPNPCPPATGACCVGTDCSIETEDDCTGMGGTYQGDDTTCSPNPCGAPLDTGACCHPDHSCTTGTEAECTGSGGIYLGNGSSCSPNPCGGATCTPPQFECFVFCCNEFESCCGPVSGCCPEHTRCCHGRSCCFSGDPVVSDEQCCPEGSITDCCGADGTCCEVGTNLTGCCGPGFHCSGTPFGHCLPDEGPLADQMFDAFWN